MFLLNSRHPLFCVTSLKLPSKRFPFFRRYRDNLPSSFNIVFSTPSSIRRIHLCRFRVRSDVGAISWTVFRARCHPIDPNMLPPPSLTHWPRNIHRVPIDYDFRPRLRGRLTLRGQTLRRNPWIFGDKDFHLVYRYLCQHSHFPYLQASSQMTLLRHRERSATTPENSIPGIRRFGLWLYPRYIFGARRLV